MQHEFIVSRGTTTSGQQKQFPTKRLETQSQIVYNVLHTADMLSHRFMAWSVIQYWLIVIRDSTQQHGLNVFLFFQIETYKAEVLFLISRIMWNKNTVKSSILTLINFSLSIYTTRIYQLSPWITNSWIVTCKLLQLSALLADIFPFVFTIASNKCNFKMP